MSHDDCQLVRFGFRRLGAAHHRVLRAVLPAVLILAGAGVAAAQDHTVANDECAVTLAWDANSETDLAGYLVLWGHASRVYMGTVEVGVMTEPVATLTLPAGPTYFFAVRAFNTIGQHSGLSNEVSTACGGPVGPLRVPLPLVGVTVTITG